MTGIVVTTYNRPKYLEACLRSLAIANRENTYVAIVDDASPDPHVYTITLRYCNVWNSLIRKSRNSGICKSLKTGFDLLIAQGCDVIMNLDPDAVVRPDFVQRMAEMVKQYPFTISTGFNTLSHDDKSRRPRHAIVQQYADHATKRSIGGINMAMTPKFYRLYVEPNLISDKDWDWRVSNALARRNNLFRVVTPSIIEHIGEESTFAGRHNHDKAHDYDLPAPLQQA